MTSQQQAKELLLLYQLRKSTRFKTYGGSKIAHEVWQASQHLPNTHFLTREDIDKWLSGRTRLIREDKFQAIMCLITSPQFAKEVPEVRTQLYPRETSIETGILLSQLCGYGTKSGCAVDIAPYDGFWRVTPSGVNAEDSSDPDQVAGYICIQSIDGHDFAIAHVIPSWNTHGGQPEFRTSGYLFQKDGQPLLRTWDRFDRWESRMDVTKSTDPRSGTDANTLRETVDHFFLRTVPHYQDCFWRCVGGMGDVPMSHLSAWKVSGAAFELRRKFDDFLWSVIPK